MALSLFMRVAADWVWPPRCWVCTAAASKVRSRLPASCDEHRIRPGFEHPRCARCAGPLPDGIAEGSKCARCRHRPPRYTAAHCALPYEGAAKDWILRFKHGGRSDLAAPLASIVDRSLDDSVKAPSADDVLVPVPLHGSRRLARGYDQALLLARALSDLGRGKVRPALVRTRATAEQGAALAGGRRANVAGAFRVPPGTRFAPGTTVWLVDDVLTTGATASACAGELRRTGATEIRVLAIARA